MVIFFNAVADINIEMVKQRSSALLVGEDVRCSPSTGLLQARFFFYKIQAAVIRD
jgi:hypothetical protein